MQTFYLVNDMIKVRDFWMPFAPSILDTHSNHYLINYDDKKNIPYFMISAYDSTDEFHLKCRAAMHQGDKTARPQVVTKEFNEDFYNLLSEFKKQTGIGALLNTSFRTWLSISSYSRTSYIYLRKSGLEYLAMEKWLISKI